MQVADVGSWKPKIGILKTQAWRELGASMLGAVQVASAHARENGATVTELEPLRLYEDAQWAQEVIQNYEIGRALAFEYDRHRDLLSPALRQALTGSLEIPIDRYVLAQDIARQARIGLAEIFNSVDVLLAPSANDIAPLGLDFTGDPLMSRVWTLMGYPCVNVPGLSAPQGMPLGLQVIAPFGSDELALRAGAWLQSIFTRNK